jgi:hypothetical protein
MRLRLNPAARCPCHDLQHHSPRRKAHRTPTRQPNVRASADPASPIRATSDSRTIYEQTNQPRHQRQSRGWWTGESLSIRSAINRRSLAGSWETPRSGMRGASRTIGKLISAPLRSHWKHSRRPGRGAPAEAG